MKIALVNENSQKNQNAFILKVLEKVAKKYDHQVFNYGVSLSKEADIDYVNAGILIGILLNSQAVDFVISGCSSGEGILITANSMPRVICGYVGDEVDAELFQRINAGNAVSIPFGKMLGVGFEISLEAIFERLFQTEIASGFPSQRREIQEKQRFDLDYLKRRSQKPMELLLEEIDPDRLYQIIHNEYFEENFFANSKNDRMSEYIKDIFDAWEEE